MVGLSLGTRMILPVGEADVRERQKITTTRAQNDFMETSEGVAEEADIEHCLCTDCGASRIGGAGSESGRNRAHYMQGMPQSVQKSAVAGRIGVANNT